MNIRVAEIEDAQSLCELSTQLDYPTSGAEFLDRLRLILDLREHVVLVADSDGGSVVGWIHLFVALRLQTEAFAEFGGAVW